MLEFDASDGKSRILTMESSWLVLILVRKKVFGDLCKKKLFNYQIFNKFNKTHTEKSSPKISSLLFFGESRQTDLKPMKKNCLVYILWDKNPGSPQLLGLGRDKRVLQNLQKIGSRTMLGTRFII